MEIIKLYIKMRHIHPLSFAVPFAAVLLLVAAASIPAVAKSWKVADGAPAAEPAMTCRYAVRDTCSLYLDFYPPTLGSNSCPVSGHACLSSHSSVPSPSTQGCHACPASELQRSTVKPAILFAFGGGFVSGERDRLHYRQWIQRLNDEGYPVFSIDYRLGLKGQNVKGVKMIGAIGKAIDIGVEDMYSATAYIVNNAAKFGIDPKRIVVCGSSAGAIIAMQAEYDLCNGYGPVSVLPEGFRYAGVMSFSGAIFSTHGKVRYAEPPAPQLLLHGTADKVVTYKKIRLFNIGLFGSDAIARRLNKEGYPYTIVRYKDHGHDIADLMYFTLPDQLRFLDELSEGRVRTADIFSDDPAVPFGDAVRNLKELY